MSLLSESQLLVFSTLTKFIIFASLITWPSFWDTHFPCLPAFYWLLTCLGWLDKFLSPRSFLYLSYLSKFLPSPKQTSLLQIPLSPFLYSSSSISGNLAFHIANGTCYHFNFKKLVLVSLTNWHLSGPLIFVSITQSWAPLGKDSHVTDWEFFLSLPQCGLFFEESADKAFPAEDIKGL